MPIIDPELLAYVDEVQSAWSSLADMRAHLESLDVRTSDGLAAMRSTMEPGGSFSVIADDGFIDRTITVSGRNIPIRILHHPEPSAVYIDIHGGAWFGGSPRMSDVANRALGSSAGVTVVSVDYRRPPEHRYPAAIDDCEAVSCWLLDHAKAEFGSERLLIGGASAGAHLAACTLLRIRDRHDAVARFMGANLVAGAYDLTMTPSLHMASGSGGLSRDGLEAAIALFTGGLSEEALRDPDLSPLYADLAGLCPALFTVGAIDALVDDSMFMAARWELAGNQAELAVYPESPHGFGGLPVQMAVRSRERIHEFLLRCIDATGSGGGDSSPS